MSKFVKYMERKFKDFPTHSTDYGVLVKADNMEVIRKITDGYFDLLLTDPPYGIGEDGETNHSRGKGTGFEEQNRRDAVAEATQYTPKDWDNDIPPAEYFKEVKRITKDQIIFGGNYFQSVMIEDKKDYEFVYDSDGEQVVRYKKKPALGATNCWIVWDKENGGTHFADFEMAWTSFETACRFYRFKWNGMLQGNMKKKDKRIHPTQKPVQLMRYILRDYADKGDRIIDTHSGSATTGIACIDLGMNYLLVEQDGEYFDDSSERLEYFKYGYNSKLKDGDENQRPQMGLQI